MSQGWGDISPHATMHWGLGGTPIHGGQGHHGMDGTETPPRCASGCHGVTPWQMGDSEPPYNEGVSWEGLGGVIPVRFGGTVGILGDIIPRMESCPPRRGVQ